MVGWGPFFEYIQWMVTSIPIMVGRLSLYLAEEVSLHAFMTPSTQSWELQDHILRDIEICVMDFDFDRAFDGINGMVPTFNLISFTRKDTPYKAQHILGNSLFSKCFLTWK